MTEDMNRDELQAAIRDVLRKINIDESIKAAPVFTLEKMLDFRGITELRRLGKYYEVKRYSKLPKPALIEGIVQALRRPGLLRLILREMDESQLEFFQLTLAESEHQADQILPDVYLPAQKLGIMQSFYHQDKFFIVIPEEVRQAFEQLEPAKFFADMKFRFNLIDVAIAAINLYGVISQPDLIELFNRQSDRKTTIDEMFSILIDEVYDEIGFCFWKDYLVDDVFEENDFKDVPSVLKDRKGKPRYQPPFEEFIRYADWDYYEFTPQLAALQDYLDTVITDPDEVLDLIDEIHVLCQIETRPQELFDLLEAKGIIFDGIDQLKEVMQLIVDVQNNTRLWSNHGHTPNEIYYSRSSKILPFPVDRAKTGVKIGRNDPCPCGSGKKYKNCCAKPDQD